MDNESLKRAKKKYNEKSTINKTVQFNKNTEHDLIDFLEKSELPFGTLVKELLRKEMSK